MRLWLILSLLVTAGWCQLDDWDQFRLIFEDNFDTLDLVNNWDHDITANGGGNGEFQVYVPEAANSYTQDGILYLKPIPLWECIDPRTGQPFGREFFESGTLDLYEMYGRCTLTWENGCKRLARPQGPTSENEIPPIMSARLISFQRFKFTYGRVEIRAKMPVGDWLWPGSAYVILALWMLPEDSVYGDWPVSGEIDIIEVIGNEDYVDGAGTPMGMQKMGSTMHWGPDPGQNRHMMTHQLHYNETVPFGRNFHTYVLDWTPNGIRWYVDGIMVNSVPDPPADQNPDWTGFWDFGAPWNEGTVNPWADALNQLTAPFDRDFHLLMNVAVGGTGGFIPEDAINRGGAYPKPWLNTDGQNTGGNKFRLAEDDWTWTWTKEGDDQAMQVDYVRVLENIAV